MCQQRCRQLPLQGGRGQATGVPFPSPARVAGVAVLCLASAPERKCRCSAGSALGIYRWSLCYPSSGARPLRYIQRSGYAGQQESGRCGGEHDEVWYVADGNSRGRQGGGEDGTCRRGVYGQGPSQGKTACGCLQSTGVCMHAYSGGSVSGS